MPNQTRHDEGINDKARHDGRYAIPMVESMKDIGYVRFYCIPSIGNILKGTKSSQLFGSRKQDQTHYLLCAFLGPHELMISFSLTNCCEERHTYNDEMVFPQIEMVAKEAARIMVPYQHGDTFVR